MSLNNNKDQLEIFYNDVDLVVNRKKKPKHFHNIV